MRMFQDRLDGARSLADALSFLEGERNLIVLAIPNGGVPIGEVIAHRLKAPLDVLLISRLMAPRNPDHVVGAVDEYGRISLIETTARWHHLTTQKLIGPARDAFRAMQRKRSRFRAVMPELEVRGKTVIVVNDGVSSGALMLAAVMSVKDRGASRIIASAPAGSENTKWELQRAAHMVIIPNVPAQFKGIEKFYRDFPAVSDEMVLDILRRNSERLREPPTSIRTEPWWFLADGERTIHCDADLPLGDGPFPAVLFAHGAHSDGQSQRAVPISRRLAKRGVIGVRLDFRGHGRSDGSRDECTLLDMVDDLSTVCENIICDPRVDTHRIGICGAGMGGMAGLLFAAREQRIRAIASRGIICCGEALAAKEVTAPTLLIHAEGDPELEADALKMRDLLKGPHELIRIPECNRLFGDPISMELMINASVDWLGDHLSHAKPNVGSERDASGSSNDELSSQKGESNAAT